MDKLRCQQQQLKALPSLNVHFGFQLWLQLHGRSVIPLTVNVCQMKLQLTALATCSTERKLSVLLSVQLCQLLAILSASYFLCQPNTQQDSVVHLCCQLAASAGSVLVSELQAAESLSQEGIKSFTAAGGRGLLCSFPWKVKPQCLCVSQRSGVFGTIISSSLSHWT